MSKAPENSFICQALRMRKGEKGGEEAWVWVRRTSPCREDSLAVLRDPGTDPDVGLVGQNYPGV